MTRGAGAKAGREAKDSTGLGGLPLRMTGCMGELEFDVVLLWVVEK